VADVAGDTVRDKMIFSFYIADRNPHCFCLLAVLYGLIFVF